MSCHRHKMGWKKSKIAFIFFIRRFNVGREKSTKNREDNVEGDLEDRVICTRQILCHGLDPFCSTK